MHEDRMDGNTGHSNDSLFASADEMAGDYSPHTDNNGFTPDTPARSTSRDSDSNSHSSPSSSEHVDDVYPMPNEPEVWKQAEHPDSINKLLNMTGDVCIELFHGASKMLSNSNPDVFEMPLEARFICIKLESRNDLTVSLQSGAVTNLPSCNDRIDKVWNERDGQRVFMIFSVSGAKEFCALAEMLGPSRPGKLPGWQKENCDGVIMLTFRFVKNVPFALINHIKHRNNGQPVANMWNSMMYHDNTGYHVARIFCQHPVLSSVLVSFKTEMSVNYKSQCRIPITGNTGYSASSYGSRNDKSHDPRSATRPQVYRSGGRTRRGNNDRHAMHTRPWRDTAIPPTPSHQPTRFVSGGMMRTPTPPGRNRHETLPAGTANAAQSPPLPVPSSGTPYTPSQASNHSTPSFTTEDERMLAQFASSRDAKRSDPNRARDFNLMSFAASDPFRDASMIRRVQNDAQSQVGDDWRGVNNGNHARGFQGQPYDSQRQNHGGGAHRPGQYDHAVGGLGISSGGSSVHMHQSHQPSYSCENVSHLPSPATSSQPSNFGGSPQSSETRGQQSSGFVLPSPPAITDMTFRREHGHPAPQSTPGAKQVGFTDTPYSGQHYPAKPGNPIKHSQSLPVILEQLSHRLSAQHLRTRNSDANSDDVKTVVSGSPSVQDWVSLTPTRTTAVKSGSSADMALTVTSQNDSYESPEKAVRSADLAGKLKWHKGQADALAIEIKVAQGSGFPIFEEKVDLLTWHKAKATCLEVEIASARKEHDSARSEVAHEMAKRPTPSTGTPNNSAEWPSWTATSSSESRFVTPEVDNDSNIDHSKDCDGEQSTLIGRTIRHRRGNATDGGFTGSFDARMSANVDNLISSPTRSNATPAMEPARIHGHPPPRTHVGPIQRPQDSFTKNQNYIAGNDNGISDLASQPDPVGDEDVIFSPRGRENHFSLPLRRSSEMSYGGGVKLKDGYIHK